MIGCRIGPPGPHVYGVFAEACYDEPSLAYSRVHTSMFDGH